MLRTCGADDVDRVDWIGLAVEDQVGGVQSDGEVGKIYVANHPRHGGRRFLSGFHEEVLAVAVAVFGDCANGLDRLRIKRIGRILGNESAVGLHLADAKQFCKVGNLPQGINARSACLRWHDTDCRWPLQEVPLERSRSDDFDGGCYHVDTFPTGPRSLSQHRP